MTWQRGREAVARALDSGHLEQITGAGADGAYLLEKAREHLTTAQEIQDTNRDAAFDITYTAGRFIGTALLAQQGLRPTVAGGHAVVSDMMSAQFGEPFEFLNRMRRVRHSIDYPRGPRVSSIDAETITRALAWTDETLRRAEILISELTIWQRGR